MHDNVVKYVDSCQIPGKSEYPVLIMELMDTSFEKHYMNSDLTLECTMRILEQVAVGLDYLHTECDPEIIHWDLKASNVLLSRKDASSADITAKIADFGLSRYVRLISVAPMTRLFATKYYAAEKPPYDCKVDIFSYGHLTLVSCTKQIIDELPDIRQGSRALTEIQRREKHLDKLHALIVKEGDQYADLENLTKKCLECNEKRPAEIIKRLSQILNRQSHDSSSTSFVNCRSILSGTSSDLSDIN